MSSFDLQRWFVGEPFLKIALSVELLRDPHAESARLAAIEVALRSELIRNGSDWGGPRQLRIYLGGSEGVIVKGSNATAEVKLAGFRTRLDDRDLAQLVFAGVIPVMSRWFPRAALNRIARAFLENGNTYEWKSPDLLTGRRRASVVAQFGMRAVAAELRVAQPGSLFRFPLFACPPAVQFWLPRLGLLRAEKDRVWVEMSRGAMFSDQVKGRKTPRVFVTGRGETGVRRFVVEATDPKPVVIEDWATGIRAGAGLATWKNRGWSRQELKSATAPQRR